MEKARWRKLNLSIWETKEKDYEREREKEREVKQIKKEAEKELAEGATDWKSEIRWKGLSVHSGRELNRGLQASGYWQTWCVEVCLYLCAFH